MIALISAFCGCDPAQDAPVSSAGPAFLIVAPAAVQPSSPSEGTTMYIQARGGTFVGLTSYGGKLRFAGLPEETTETCVELSGSEPLYVVIKPDQVESTIEVRLYADCDVGQPGGTAFEMCQNHDWFVKSAIVPVQRPDGGVVVLDAGRSSDGGAGREGGADAKEDGRVADAAASAKVSDAASDRGDR
jgi:hypothetical protein